MLGCHQIVNSYQHSCTYILYHENENHAWLVDCGDYQKIKEWLIDNKKDIAGVFITHCHMDHIYGLIPLLKDLPMVSIYVSANKGIECLQDVRLNLTKYTPQPYIIKSEHFVELNDGDKIRLFGDLEMYCYQAEGHTPDSMIYRVGNWLLTGDAYIPPLQVVTKLPGADKTKAAESVERIKKIINKYHLTVLAGHSC